MTSKGKVLVTDNVHLLMLEKLTELGYTPVYRPGTSTEDLLATDESSVWVGLVINSNVLVFEPLLKHCSGLRFVARLGSGLEIIDQEACMRYGVAVFSSPEGNCDAVAEHAMGLLLSVLNNFYSADKQLRQHHWAREASRGTELGGQTVGIWGFGHTGRAFAKRLWGFGVRVLAYDKYKPQGYASEFPFVEEVSPDMLFEQATVVSFHLPLSSETIGLANLAFWKSFKHPVWVLNTSRGKVVDTQDLVTALEQKLVLGAGLDVFEDEKVDSYKQSPLLDVYNQLFAMENVLITPHVAGWTYESKYKLAAVLCDKIRSLT